MLTVKHRQALTGKTATLGADDKTFKQVTKQSLRRQSTRDRYEGFTQ
jgi:hypothetical protein